MKALLTTLALAIALAPSFAIAQTSSKNQGSSQASPKPAKMSGTVVSATDTSLVITGKSKKETSFILSPETKKTGTLSPGSKVTVQYHMEGKDHVASMVQASTMTASSSSSKHNKPKTGS